MTHSQMGHDSWVGSIKLYVSFAEYSLSFIGLFCKRDPMGHDSSAHVTRLMHTCDKITGLFCKRALSKRQYSARETRTRDTTHAHMWHDSFTRATWLANAPSSLAFFAIRATFLWYLGGGHIHMSADTGQFSIYFKTFPYISIYFDIFRYISIYFDIFPYISIYFDIFPYISILFPYISI